MGRESREEDVLDSEEMRAKLRALDAYVRKWMGDPRDRPDRPYKRYFDYRLACEVLDKYAQLRDTLRSEHPSMFRDLSVRETPPREGKTEFNGHGYVPRHSLELLLRDIEYCLELLSSVTPVSVPSMKVTRQGIFFAGEYFDALRLVSKLLSHAERKIVIIDSYIDENVLNLVAAKRKGVKVDILTKLVPPDLSTKGKAFNKQYGGLSIRTSEAFHDRFLIIDETELYHFGASVKDAGHRGFMFSRVEEPTVVKQLLDGWQREWSKAKVVVNSS